MVSLYLVGTCHLDLNGPERLEKLLGFVRPDIIGIETTIEGYQQIIQKHEEFESHKSFFKSDFIKEFGQEGAENILKFWNMLGYEVWVPNEFSKENGGLRVVCCDKFIDEDLKTMVQRSFGKTDLTLDRIAKSDFKEFQKSIDKNYSTFSVAQFQAELEDDPDLVKRMLHDRDDTAEQRIRQAFSVTDHSLVYVGGLMHIFGDYHNLYEKLKDLSPTRIKLPEVDRF